MIRLLTSQWRVTLLLAFDLCAVALIVMQWLPSRNAAPAVDAAIVKPSDSVPVELPRDENAEKDYTALTARPIFHQDRRYIPAATIEQIEPAQPPPDYTLTGYLSLPGRPSKAFLRSVASGKTMAVSVGDSVERWTVLSTSAHAVQVRLGDRTFEIGKAGVEGVPSTERVAAPGGAASSESVPRVEAPSPLPSVPASLSQQQLTPSVGGAQQVPQQSSLDRNSDAPQVAVRISVRKLAPLFVTASRLPPDQLRTFEQPELPPEFRLP